MKLTKADGDDDGAGNVLVNAYGDRGFRVGETRFNGSLVIVNGRARAWGVATVADMTPASLAVLENADPAVEIVLVGTGAELAFLPGAVRDWLERAGINVDVMDTGAAARTYNVLALEGRRVAAALIAVP
ncbi:MAG: Mth938-like domain-containing protein [Sphingomonadales bacterium]